MAAASCVRGPAAGYWRRVCLSVRERLPARLRQGERLPVRLRQGEGLPVRLRPGERLPVRLRPGEPERRPQPRAGCELRPCQRVRVRQAVHARQDEPRPGWLRCWDRDGLGRAGALRPGYQHSPRLVMHSQARRGSTGLPESVAEYPSTWAARARVAACCDAAPGVQAAGARALLQLATPRPPQRPRFLFVFARAATPRPFQHPRPRHDPPHQRGRVHEDHLLPATPTPTSDIQARVSL